MTQYTIFGEREPIDKRGALAEKFVLPPFSVLNARSGEWQERKRAWMRIGIKSHEGRHVTPFCSLQAASITGGYKNIDGSRKVTSTVSIFDPVLCEIMYKWYCSPGGQVVDPFAGGSIRGIVASLLGYRYWGCDLSLAQVAANSEQAKKTGGLYAPVWYHADARQVIEPSAPRADFIFSCPPYGDLERYSDDPLDLSTMNYHDFLEALSSIVLQCVAKLRSHRFACFVVGDFRDKSGNLRGFPSDFVLLAKNAGLSLYSEAVLITQIGSFAAACGRTFSASRKLTKTHQSVLIFVKGNGRRAADAVGIGSAG